MSAELNETIHAPNRLRICAFLSTVQEAEFAAVRATLGVSDSVLSKHVRILEQSGYLQVIKPTGLGRVRTWLALTAEGRRAYRDHLMALRALLTPEAIPEPRAHVDPGGPRFLPGGTIGSVRPAQ